MTIDQLRDGLNSIDLPGNTKVCVWLGEDESPLIDIAISDGCVARSSMKSGSVADAPLPITFTSLQHGDRVLLVAKQPNLFS